MFWCKVGGRGATKRVLRKLLKKQMRPPRVMIADKLARYGVAKGEVMPGTVYRQHKGLNNRAETSHQPTRRQERQIKEFESTGQAQRFLFLPRSDEQPAPPSVPDIFPVDLIQLTRPDKVTVLYGTATRGPGDRRATRRGQTLALRAVPVAAGVVAMRVSYHRNSRNARHGRRAPLSGDLDRRHGASESQAARP